MHCKKIIQLIPECADPVRASCWSIFEGDSVAAAVKEAHGEIMREGDRKKNKTQGVLSTDLIHLVTECLYQMCVYDPYLTAKQ